MNILIRIKSIDILILNYIVDRKNTSNHKVTHLRMHRHRIDAYWNNRLSIAHLHIAHLLALLLLKLVNMHKLIHMI